MARSRVILPVLVLALAAAFAATSAAAGKEDKDNYERILAILITGSAENKKTAKEALRGMGDAGLELLKTDSAAPDTPRGAVAWAVLKELLIVPDVEALRDFARKNLETFARDWNGTYKAKPDPDRRARLKSVVSDYVDLLVTSDKPKDFELLLKTLKHSLIVSEAKADYGAEFDVWMRVWKLLTERVAASDSVRDLQSWQATVDDHFRRYSTLKNYSGLRTIQAYHTATLQFMQRIDVVRKKPAPPVPPATPDKPEPEKPATPDEKAPIDLTKPDPKAPDKPDEKKPEDGAAQ